MRSQYHNQVSTSWQLHSLEPQPYFFLWSADQAAILAVIIEKKLRRKIQPFWSSNAPKPRSLVFDQTSWYGVETSGLTIGGYHYTQRLLAAKRRGNWLARSNTFPSFLYPFHCSMLRCMASSGLEGGPGVIQCVRKLELLETSTRRDA